MTSLTPHFLLDEPWQSLWLTLELALATTFFLLLLGLPLAQWLNRSKSRTTVFVEALVTMPIVLPPTVIGFYLLVLFAPRNPLGSLWMKLTGHTLAFSFSGLVVGSIIYSLPFAVQPFQTALQSIPRSLLDVAKTEGASAWQAFYHITLPLSRRGIAAGAILSFAHTLGEFGLVLMLGGSIPGKTKVASIALYDEVQKLDYRGAHMHAALLLTISFVLILVMTFLRRNFNADTSET